MTMSAFPFILDVAFLFLAFNHLPPYIYNIFFFLLKNVTIYYVQDMMLSTKDKMVREMTWFLLLQSL